ncbi:MAG: EF-P lysine aminoacylase EpmA [Chromatiaceae bacterium]
MSGPPGPTVAGRVPDASQPLDWRPTADQAALQARARLYAGLRRFFADAGVMEVETPLASRAGLPDPALESWRTAWSAPAGVEPLWLQTSPEFPMKRLLAAGSGPIYQICKVFRDGERGRRHHPEFSLLEWYRPGWGLDQLMAEVADLVRMALGQPERPVEILAYRDLFLSRLALDPFHARTEELQAQARAIVGAEDLDLDRDGWLDLLLTHCLEADLGRDRLTFIRDYPPSQAALARIRPGPEPVAERFELYLEGLELANGFLELTDAGEQRRRFEQDQAQRRDLGLAVPPLDESFLAALEAGLPASSGVALGLDRLLMVKMGVSHIDQVLAFPIEWA